RYVEHLQPLEAQGLVRLPRIPEGCTSNYHIFYIVLADMQTRDALIAALKQDGIQAVFHYIPLHSSPMGQQFGYRASDLPVTEDVSGRLLRLPLYCDLTEEEQTKVVQHITAFLQG